MAAIRGKAYWAKILGDAVPGYDPAKTEWSIDVSLDDKAMELIEQLDLTHKVRNRDDDRGNFITFKRPGVKQDGEPSKPITVVDKYKRAWDPDVMIGNGSDVFVQFNVNEGEYRGKPWKKPGILKLMVVDLVEYEGGKDELPDFSDEDPADEDF